MSLAQEIAALFELHKMGALTMDEFKDAKAKVIMRFSSEAPTAGGTPAPTASIQSPPPAECSSNGSSMNHERDFAASSEAARLFPRVRIHVLLQKAAGGDLVGQKLREGALGHLQRILTNLLSFPNDPKYTQLRRTNRVLSSEVLIVPGVMDVLSSVGFVASDDDKLVWDAARCPADLLEEALAAVAYVREIEDGNDRRRLEILKLRRSPMLEIRMDNARQAQESGELVQFLVKSFAADVAGDGLSSSLGNIRVISKLLDNVCAHPHDERYSRVRLENPAVYKSVVQQTGGLELLLLVAGCTLDEQAAAGGTYLLFPPCDDSATTAVRQALALLTEVESSVRSIQRTREEEERRTAEASARLERQRERNRMSHQQERASRQTDDEESMTRFSQRYEKKRSAADMEDSDDSSSSETPRPRQVSGNRITVAEALARLMGKHSS